MMIITFAFAENNKGIHKTVSKKGKYKEERVSPRRSDATASRITWKVQSLGFTWVELLLIDCKPFHLTSFRLLRSPTSAMVGPCVMVR
jgi:hypothetical protein